MTPNMYVLNKNALYFSISKAKNLVKADHDIECYDFQLYKNPTSSRR